MFREGFVVRQEDTIGPEQIVVMLTERQDHYPLSTGDTLFLCHGGVTQTTLSKVTSIVLSVQMRLPSQEVTQNSGNLSLGNINPVRKGCPFLALVNQTSDGLLEFVVGKRWHDERAKHIYGTCYGFYIAGLIEEVEHNQDLRDSSRFEVDEGEMQSTFDRRIASQHVRSELCFRLLSEVVPVPSLWKGHL